MSAEPLLCDWSILPPEGSEDAGSHPCGRKARLEFLKEIRTMGHHGYLRYPRCKRHSPPRTIALAGDQGYTVHMIDKEDDDGG